MIRRSAERARRAGALVALGVAAALAGCGSGGAASSGGSASSAPSRLAPASAGQAAGHAMTRSLPARIDRRPQGFVSTELLSPLVNAWRTADRHGFIEVDAGALSSDRSIGVFAIFRHDFTGVDQSANLVKVLGSGGAADHRRAAGRRGRNLGAARRPHRLRRRPRRPRHA
jgi:hypothetical protein